MITAMVKAPTLINSGMNIFEDKLGGVEVTGEDMTVTTGTAAGDVMIMVAWG